MKLSSVRMEIEGPNGRATRAVAIASDLIAEPDTPKHRAGREAAANRVVQMFAECYAEANPASPAETDGKPKAP